MKHKLIGMIHYIFLFIFFFCTIQFFCAAFKGDSLYNYGFSYAVSRGEIPYKDFNMIIPPFGAFFYALPFLLFSHSYIIFNVTQAFLLCVFFHLLYKMYGKKAYLLLIFMVGIYPFPFISVIFPGYNFLLLMELLLLIYFESFKKNDYEIGLLLGISLLTKQTVGFCFLLVSFYYGFSDIQKLGKRLIGMSIPVLVFLIYLLLTKSLDAFMDHCFLGMFDFTSKNGRVMDIYFVLFILGMILLLWFIRKNHKDLTYYYILAFSSIAVPLFDYYHVSLFLFSLLWIGIPHIPISYSKKEIIIFSSILSLVSVLTFSYLFYHPMDIVYSKFPNFEGVLMERKIWEGNKRIRQFIEENRNENLIILGNNAYFYKISSELEINHYDLLNYGNHGKNGTQKIIEKLKKEEKPIFIFGLVEYQETSDRQQLNKEVMKYVLEHYPEKRKIGSYLILEGG